MGCHIVLHGRARNKIRLLECIMTTLDISLNAMAKIKEINKDKVQQMDNQMKIHYSQDVSIRYRYRKVKSVIDALGVQVA